MCSKILHGTDGFTSPPKEVVLRIFITLKKSLPSAGFEPANLWSNGKHANHYTADDDESRGCCLPPFASVCLCFCLSLWNRKCSNVHGYNVRRSSVRGLELGLRVAYNIAIIALLCSANFCFSRFQSSFSFSCVRHAPKSQIVFPFFPHLPFRLVKARLANPLLHV
jgi:hypothetical protein